MEHFDPSTLAHLPAILDEATKHVLSGAENRIGVRGVDGVVRLFNVAYNRLRGRGASETLELRADRLELLIATLINELQENGLTAAFEQESAEPSTVSFTADAIEAGVSSPSEPKRALLGRMVARRMSSATESVYELYLRDALRIVAVLNENQLSLLAALMLTTSTPIPFSGFETAADSAHFFVSTFGGAMEALASATWSRSDVEKLLADAAISEVSGEDIGRTRHYYPPRFPISETVARTFNSRDEGWDEIKARVNELFLVHDEPNRPRQHVRSPISDLWLRPVGAVMAALVLEAHIGRRIRFVEWESLDTDDLRDSDLVAPFSSADLLRQVHDQNVIRRRTLRETLERDTPDIVGKRMADSMRGYPYSP